MANDSINIKVTLEENVEKPAKKAVRSIEEIGDSAKKTESKFKASTVAMGLAMYEFAKGLASTAVDIGKFAVGSASNLEQTRVAFETMLGSTEKAKKTLKDLSDFAKKTPFELPQLQDLSKQLLAYGVTQEKLIPTIQMLGNISAGVGKDKLPFLTLAFGQVRAAGKLTGQELRQFTEAGVPMLELLAKRFKTSTANVQELVRKGKVGFKDVEAALASTTSEGGKFFNLMEKQSKTFGGRMSNLNDLMGQFARSLVGISEEGDIMQGGIFAGLSSTAEGLMNFLETNKGAIIGSIQGIIKGFQDLTTQLVSNLTPVLRNLWQAFQNIYSALSTVFAGFQPIISVIRDNFFPLLTVVTSQIASFTLALSQNKDLLNALVPIITAAVVAYGTFTIATTIIGWIKGMTAAFVGFTAVLQANPVVAILSAILAAVGALYIAWENNFGGIREIVGGFVSFMEDAGTVIGGVFGVIKDAATGAFQWIIDLIDNTIGRIQRFIGEAEKAAKPFTDIQSGLAGGVPEKGKYVNAPTGSFTTGWTGGFVSEKGIEHFAKGGKVGKGSKKSNSKDTVPAMLAPGEYVINPNLPNLPEQIKRVFTDPTLDNQMRADVLASVLNSSSEDAMSMLRKSEGLYDPSTGLRTAPVGIERIDSQKQFEVDQAALASAASQNQANAKQRGMTININIAGDVDSSRRVKEIEEVLMSSAYRLGLA